MQESLTWVQAGLLFGGLLLGAFLDVSQRRIPNRFSVGFLAVGLMLRGLLHGWVGLGWGLAGALVGLALLLVPFSRGWVKGGDVKLLAAMGGWLGPVPTVVATILGLVVGGGIALVLLIGQPALRKQVGQNLLGWMLGGGLTEPAQRSTRATVPLGAALAVGGALTFMMGWGN